MSESGWSRLIVGVCGFGGMKGVVDSGDSTDLIYSRNSSCFSSMVFASFLVFLGFTLELILLVLDFPTLENPSLDSGLDFKGFTFTSYWYSLRWPASLRSLLPLIKYPFLMSSFIPVLTESLPSVQWLVISDSYTCQFSGFESR